MPLPIEVSNGGTGATTLASNNLLLGNSTSPLAGAGSATDGQIPIGSTGNTPSLATLSAGAGISITNGAGSITLANTNVNNMVLIQTQTASNSATIDFTTGITSTYLNYVFVLNNILPVSGTNAGLALRVSTNAGASWLADLNYFSNARSLAYDGTTINNNTVTSGNQWVLTSAMSNTEPAGLVVWIYNATSGGWPQCRANASYYRSGLSLYYGFTIGHRRINTLINAFRFYFQSDNISTGTFSLYGLLQ